MAIGLGLMFGLRLPLNFDAPYRATSIRETWRRWHMTLSRFLRDYLYIPLGGNRHGSLLQARNVVVTMLLGGLWHGAAWTYVAWGGVQGVALAINGLWVRRRWPMPAALGWVLTTVFFVAAFSVFRAADLPTAGRILSGMVGMDGLGSPHVKDSWALIVGSLAAVLGPTSQEVALGRMRPVAWAAVPAGMAMVGLLLMAGGRLPAEFIYFQF
jgi:D-alanyl-lipoteichoic acid acyltransferase DltB (MBOAT superfamily)